MTLGEFHQLVSDNLRRGSAQNSAIPQQTKLAVQWMERNYTFRYMEKFRLLQLVPGDRTISFPDNIVVKSIKFVRLIDSDGRYLPLNKIEPGDLTGIRTGDRLVPKAFWGVGDGTLVLDVVPTEALNGEAVLFEYTDWPTAENSRHPLLDFAADVLMQQTLVFMATLLRDAAMAGVYKTLRDEALDTLTRAEDEGQFGGESISMAFRPLGS